MFKYRYVALFGLLWCGLIASAQTINTCPEIVEFALGTVEENCQSTGRNQACYGNISLEIEPRSGVESLQFEQIGDVVDVADVQSIRLSPMDEENGAWGVVLMRLQANLPDTLPGQNVTFLLFGDVSLMNAVHPDSANLNPMQAFYLTTGISDAACEEAPESGLLVQTPDGVNEVNFSINGVDVAMGSTVFFQTQPDESLTVSTLEGAAILRRDGFSYTAIAGTRLNLDLQEVMGESAEDTPTSALTRLEAYEVDFGENLPLNLLERRIEVEAPMPLDELDTIRERVEEGLSLCDGTGALPICDRLPGFPLRERERDRSED